MQESERGEAAVALFIENIEIMGRIFLERILKTC